MAVRVTLPNEWLTVTVTDNGRGMGPQTRSSGLANLKERARLLDGTCEVSSPEEGGTQVEWRVRARP